MIRRGAELDLADEANKVTHMSWIPERLRGMEVFSDDELVVVDSGLPSDTFNLVCRARLLGASLPERIACVVRHFTSAERPFTWWVGPADRPANLSESLEAAGFVATGTEPGMAADLDALGTTDLSPAGLRIERVETTDQVLESARMLAALTTPPEPTIVRFFERAAPALLEPDAPIRLYLGYLEDRAVATAELTIGGGIVGLYNITTLVEHRRKGIGSAMTLRPLLDAREDGFRAAVLQASEEGFPIYSRLGFETTGIFTEYHLPPA